MTHALRLRRAALAPFAAVLALALSGAGTFAQQAVTSQQNAPAAQATAPASYAFTLTNLVIEGMGGRYRIPKLDVLGARQDEAAWRAALTQPSAAALAGLEADLLVAGELAYEFVTMGQRGTATYTDVRAEGLAKGRIAKLTAASAVTTSALNGESVEGTMRLLSVMGLDLGAAAALMGENAPANAAPTQICDRFEAAQYSWKTAAAQSEASAIFARGLKLGSPIRPWRQLAATPPAADDEDSDEAKQKREREMLAVLPSILRAFAVDQMGFEKLTIHQTAPEQTARLENVVVSDLRDGAITLRVGAMEFGASSRARLRGFSLEAFDFARFADLLARTGTAPSGFNDLNPAAAAPKFARLAFDEGSLCGEDEESCGAQDWSVARNVSIERKDVEGGLDLLLSAKRFESAPSAAAPNKDDVPLAAAGSFSSKLEWRREGGALTLRDGALSLDGRGSATFSLALTNVTEALFADNRMVAMVALAPIGAQKIDLRLVDAGAVDALAIRAAKGGGKKTPPVKEARKRLAAKLQSDWKRLAVTPAGKTILEAVRGFALDPAKPLVLNLTARPPVSIVDVFSLPDPFKILGRAEATTRRE